MSKQEANAPHPRREPRLPGPLSLGRLEEVFSDGVDFAKREVYRHGDSQRKAVVCYIDGQARSERLNDYILRPLAQDPMLASAPESQLFELMERRSDSTATIFCTQYRKDDWIKRLGEGVQAEAIVDRYAHTAYWIETGSMNMREYFAKPRK